MAVEPNTHCTACGRQLDARGACLACNPVPAHKQTGDVGRSPLPPQPGTSSPSFAGTGQTAGPELTGRICPYCRFPLKEGAPIETCGACGTVHHHECWQDNAGCSVTGCVNGPANTTATHVLTPATATQPATAATAPPPQPPQKPPPPASRRYPTGAILTGAIVVALLGAGAAVALSSSSKNHNTPTVTVKERTVEKTVPVAPTPTATTHTPSITPTSTTTHAPTSAPPPTQTGPSPSEREAHAVAAMDSYWSDIENHDFSGAYQIEEPSAGSSESEWVQAEEREGVERVAYSFEPGSLEGNEATVNVDSLQTVARKTGCYTWTGYYRLTDYGGTWKITHDGLERHSC